MVEDVTVTHNPAERRFESNTDAGLARADYRCKGREVAFVHTEVPELLEGKGVGTALVRTALEWARAEDLRVIPLCVFFAAYLRRHPELQDLVPEEHKKWLDPEYDE